MMMMTKVGVVMWWNIKRWGEKKLAKGACLHNDVQVVAWRCRHACDDLDMMCVDKQKCLLDDTNYNQESPTKIGDLHPSNDE